MRGCPALRKLPLPPDCGWKGSVETPSDSPERCGVVNGSDPQLRAGNVGSGLKEARRGKLELVNPCSLRRPALALWVQETTSSDDE